MLVALASAAAIAILMPAGPDDGCPSPRQVSEAMTAHLPGMVLPLGRAPGPNVLRLSVTSDAGGTLRVDLSDPDGGPLLRRRVEPETGPRARAADCAALAETAALIVDRYWHEVGYEVPAPPAPATPKPPPPPPPPAVQTKPAPPPRPPTPEPPRPAEPEPAAPEPARQEPAPSAPLRPPAWWLAAGVNAGYGDRGGWQRGASVALAVERPRGKRRVGLRFSAGARYPREQPWLAQPSWGIPAGHATMFQAPVGMDAYLAFPVGLGRLEPGLGVDLNVIVVTSLAGNVPASRWAAAPGVDAVLAWTIPLPREVFVRFRALGAAAVPTPITVDDAGRLRIFDTPRFRAELGIELGLWFY